MEDKNSSKKVAYFIIISLLIHATILLCLFFWKPPAAQLPATPPAPEVVFVRPQDVLPPSAMNPQKNAAGELADIAKPKVERVPEKSRFISQYNSTVKEETVAKKIPKAAKLNTEVSEEDGGKAPAPKPKTPKPVAQKPPRETPREAKPEPEPKPMAKEKPVAESTEKISLSDLQVKPQDFKEAMKPSKADGPDPDSLRLSRPSLNPGVGMGDGDHFAHDFLPNVKIGDKTYLNAQAFPDVQYFLRLKRVFRMRFNPREPLVQYFSTNRIVTGQVNVQMAMEVSPSGQVEKLFVVKSSGISGYDAEALQTVRESAPFNAPPAKILDKDGRLRMTWNFTTYL